MRKRFTSYLAAILSLGAILVLSSPAAFAAPNKHSAQSPLPFPMVQVGPFKMLDISDNYARQMVIKYGDPSVAAHMLTRIKQPLPAKFQHHDIFSSNPILSNTYTWEGYDADVLNTPYYATLIRAHFTARYANWQYTVGEWVGIGGRHGSGNLIQVGVDMRSLRLFLDLVPSSNSQAIEFQFVNPGDDIYGQVNLDSSTGMWFFDIQDVTTNNYTSYEVSYSPDQNSAEWIVEIQHAAPSTPYFGDVQFSYADWGDNVGHNGNILSPEANPTYEAYIGSTSDTCYDSPGSVTNNGTAFVGRDHC